MPFPSVEVWLSRRGERTLKRKHLASDLCLSDMCSPNHILYWVFPDLCVLRGIKLRGAIYKEFFF